MAWPNTLLPASQYSDPMRLLEDALVMVESRGDANARRSGSKYVGLLQIGPDYAQDAGIPRQDYVRELLGDARASRQAFRRYMQRYADRHQGNLALVALLHHAGPGFAKAVAEEMDRGATIDQAIAEVADRDTFSWTNYRKESAYLMRAMYWLGELAADRLDSQSGMTQKPSVAERTTSALGQLFASMGFGGSSDAPSSSATDGEPIGFG